MARSGGMADLSLCHGPILLHLRCFLHAICRANQCTGQELEWKKRFHCLTVIQDLLFWVQPDF